MDLLLIFYGLCLFINFFVLKLLYLQFELILLL